MTVQQREVLNLAEAAKYCRLSINTMKRMVRTGRIPCYQQGRTYRFDTRALDEFLMPRVRALPERRAS